MDATYPTPIGGDIGGNAAGFRFPHTIEIDDREPLFTISIPAMFGSSNESTEYGFVLFSSAYWIELLACIIATLSTGAIVGRFLYETVVRRRKENTTTAYLIGWGLVLPFWMAWPLVMLSCLDLRNAIFRFLIGGIVPIICSFRTTECIYGFCPEYATRSAQDFVFYYATVPVAKRHTKSTASKMDDSAKTTETTLTSESDEEETEAPKATKPKHPAVGDPIRCSTAKKVKHFRTFLGLLFLTGALKSILLPHEFLNVFGMGDATNDGKDLDAWYATSRYFTWQLYANSALQAMLFQMYLTTYCEALMFAFTVLTGYESEPVMDNPLLESASPMDFWGKRWNMLVHGVLKNGVYKPLRRAGGWSPTASVLATFFASGVFHEWILWLVFVLAETHTDSTAPVYRPTYGCSTVFFVWQAGLIGLELAFGKTAVVRGISRRIPKFLKPFGVVALGIPMAHYFLEPYVRSGFFFQHGALGLPMLVPMARNGR